MYNLNICLYLIVCLVPVSLWERSQLLRNTKFLRIMKVFMNWARSNKVNEIIKPLKHSTLPGAAWWEQFDLKYVWYISNTNSFTLNMYLL